MSQKSRFSETMRIDISPDVLKDSAQRGKRGVVVSPHARRKRTPTSRIGRTPGDGQEHYQDLLQSLYDAAVVTDLVGNILDVNLRALDFLQYEREELIGMHILRLIPGSDDGLIDTLLENLQDERFTLIQAYCQRNDETVFAAEIAVNKLNLDELCLCFFIRDVTRRRLAEEMMQTEHNAIQNAGNGIAIADLEGKLEYLNPAMLLTFGFKDPEELLGHNIKELWPDETSANELIELIMREADRAWTCDIEAVRQDGTPTDLQVSAACNRDADDNPTGMVFSFTDISERTRAEEAERQVERHRVMLESLGAACHHLGQPATVLLANIGLITQKLEGADTEMDEVLTSSIEAVENLSRILHKLNAVNEYRTTQYLESSAGDAAPESRILDIDSRDDGLQPEAP
ncbi:MAG: PAS domain S-box protein [Verrucomicrobia bacterium]|nr:PAS domain S-box protein [Verrucomicrobiota bacterium]MDA1086888.1 PAS domain S-box protein [Verrucomicrobiota bacterium]